MKFRKLNRTSTGIAATLVVIGATLSLPASANTLSLQLGGFDPLYHSQQAEAGTKPGTELSLNQGSSTLQEHLSNDTLRSNQLIYDQLNDTNRAGNSTGKLDVANNELFPQAKGGIPIKYRLYDHGKYWE